MSRLEFLAVIRNTSFALILGINQTIFSSAVTIWSLSHPDISDLLPVPAKNPNTAPRDFVLHNQRFIQCLSVRPVLSPYYLYPLFGVTLSMVGLLYWSDALTLLVLAVRKRAISFIFLN